MPNYSEEYKLECVGKLELLNKRGTINLEGVQIKNVRELVKFLGISSYSIYKWYKEIQYLARNMDLELVKKELAKSMDLEVLGFEGEGDVIPDFSIENKEMRIELAMNEKRDDVIDENTYGFKVLKEIETPKVEFGTRFWQFVAKNMGIKNYAMPLKQLKMKVGMELINGSGLVENGVREELRIE